jgi:hypothetical protein
LFNAVQDVVCSLNFDNKLYEEIFASRLYKFVLNDEKHYQQILKIVAGLKWIKNKEVHDYFVKYFKDNYSEKNLFINYKINPKSSSSRLLSLISGEGLCNDFQIVNISDLTPEIVQNFDNIYFIDDFIGSGSTIIGAIDTIWEIVKDKNLYIVCYATQDLGLYNIAQKFSAIKLVPEIVLEDYKSKYDKKTVAYIRSICKLCPEKDMKYGYNLAGAYVVLHNVAPNSDISMLWHPKIIYNNNKWIRLFDRELSLEILTKKNKDMIKSNGMLLRLKYNELKRKYKLSFDEFEFLVYSYGCYYTKNQLLDDKYFDSEEEFNTFVNNLIDNDYLSVKKGYIIIKNKSLYYDVGKVIDYLYKEKIKSQKKTTCNF